MIADFEWLDAESVIDLHDEILDQYEGILGLLSRDSLEGALSRPRQYRIYRPDSSVAMIAAALCCGLIQDHPFLDGNKRTALDATVFWLALNGYHLDAPESVDDTIVAVAQGHLDVDTLADILADWIEPLLAP